MMDLRTINHCTFLKRFCVHKFITITQNSHKQHYLSAHETIKLYQGLINERKEFIKLESRTSRVCISMIRQCMVHMHQPTGNYLLTAVVYALNKYGRRYAMCLNYVVYHAVLQVYIAL